MLTRYVTALNKMIMEQGRLKMREKKVPLGIEQLPVLMCIFLTKEISQQEIALYVSRDKSSVKRTVTLLQKKGLVTVHSHQDDKRKTIVSMTEAGNFVAEQVKQVAREVEDATFSSLSKKSKKELLDTLKNVFEKNREAFLSKTTKVVVSTILLLNGCLPTLSSHLSKIIFNH